MTNEPAELIIKAIKSFETFMKDVAQDVDSSCHPALRELETTLDNILEQDEWEQSWEDSGCY